MTFLQRGAALWLFGALCAGLLLGAALGERLSSLVDAADIVGALWLNALRMTIVPMLVALLITGIWQAAAMARAGRMTLRAMILMLALLWISAAMAAVVTPALLTLFPVPEGAAAALREAMGAAKPVGDVPPFGEFVRALIPTNPIGAAANDAILPLLIFTMAFAFALTRMDREKAAPVAAFFDGVAGASLIIIGWVLALAPLGVFALALVVGARVGTTAFGALAHYVVIVTAVGTVMWLASFIVAAWGARIGPIRFLRATLSPQSLAVATQSSLACLPAMVRGVRSLGVGERSADVVLPMAVALFRVTGPCMNLAVAIYAAALMDITLTPTQIAVGAGVAAITTLGAVSLPGTVSFISSIAPIAMAMGVPIEPLAILVAVEAFPDIMRTLANVTMDMAVTSSVARAEGDLDPAPAVESDGAS